jgi:hypothetical protein
MTNVLYAMAGGQDEFDKYFHVEGGQVVLNEGVDTSQMNAAQQLLADMVSSSDNYVYFAGSSASSLDAAGLFAGTFNQKGKLTALGKDAVAEFACGNGRVSGCGSLVATTGRPLQTLQPAVLANGDSVFAVIAYNTGMVQQETRIDYTGGGMGPHEPNVEAAEKAGLGQRVPPVGLFIHESAENLAFRAQGNFNYSNAHYNAIKREADIRDALHLGGGFAGSWLTRTVPGN